MAYLGNLCSVVSDVARLNRALCDARVTHLVAVPTLLQALLQIVWKRSSAHQLAAHDEKQPATAYAANAARLHVDVSSVLNDLPPFRFVVSSGEPLTWKLGFTLRQTFPGE